jgi:uncharacterized glyoxalase superfamily metalloenzyme YdcJ
MSEPVHPDVIRGLFAGAMSDMYRSEVPQYATLCTLVGEVNEATLAQQPDLRERLQRAGDLERLDVERHGAIRVGTAEELSLIGRMFAVMGMQPVGYYDLSVAGLPVHSTAFRPVEPASLARNPFRVFTSLLRLDLLGDRDLARHARHLLAGRRILTPRALQLIERAEADGGLDEHAAWEFVTEALETFRWHTRACVDHQTYQRLLSEHRLVADVVSFRGPHINHLTPRSLDIDAVQQRMPARGMQPKAVIEGPPRRQVDILLRQTAFRALEEPVFFTDDAAGRSAAGTHTARFGEVEQRGAALTPSGRALYDAALAESIAAQQALGGAATADAQRQALEQAFRVFPDDLDQMRRQGLVFLRYRATPGARAESQDTETLLARGQLQADAQVYEDFLPVSAAGIFRSNLDAAGAQTFASSADRSAFESALGRPVLDEMALYRAAERRSLDDALRVLGVHLTAARGNG